MTGSAPYPAFDGTQACADSDPDLFFPEPNTQYDTTPRALAVCSPCPLKRECLAYALTHVVHGIWMRHHRIHAGHDPASPRHPRRPARAIRHPHPPGRDP